MWPACIADLLSLRITKSVRRKPLPPLFLTVSTMLPLKRESLSSALRDEGGDPWFMAESFLNCFCCRYLTDHRWYFVQPDRIDRTEINNTHTDKKMEDGKAEMSAQGLGVAAAEFLRFIHASGRKGFCIRSEVTSPCWDFGTWWWGNGSCEERGLFFTLCQREKSWFSICVYSGGAKRIDSHYVWKEELKLGLCNFSVPGSCRDVVVKL